jgi:hypothetical protein
MEKDNALREVIKYQIEAYGGKVNPKDDFVGFINDIKALFKPMEKDNALRERVAEVIDNHLPWTREDCLDFADKIIKVLPQPASNKISGGEDKFISHIQAHLKPGEEVICKICGKTAKEIINEKLQKD